MCHDVTTARQLNAKTLSNVSTRTPPRVQPPEDLAGTVVYLASADFVTGQMIAVNGVSHMH